MNAPPTADAVISLRDIAFALFDLGTAVVFWLTRERKKYVDESLRDTAEAVSELELKVVDQFVKKSDHEASMEKMEKRMDNRFDRLEALILGRKP